MEKTNWKIELYNLISIASNDKLDYYDIKMDEKYNEINNDTNMSYGKELMVEKFSTDLTKLAIPISLESRLQSITLITVMW